MFNPMPKARFLTTLTRLAQGIGLNNHNLFWDGDPYRRSRAEKPIRAKTRKVPKPPMMYGAASEYF